jgi:hypothetical protein
MHSIDLVLIIPVISLNEIAPVVFLGVVRTSFVTDKLTNQWADIQQRSDPYMLPATEMFIVNSDGMKCSLIQGDRTKCTPVKSKLILSLIFKIDNSNNKS